LVEYEMRLGRFVVLVVSSGGSDAALLVFGDPITKRQNDRTKNRQTDEPASHATKV